MSQPPNPSDPSGQPPVDEVPREGRLLGIDYGTRRLGIAVCTPEQSIASPLQTYERSHPKVDARRICDLVDEYSAVGFVVGLPLHAWGEEGQKAHEAHVFGTWLQTTTGLPVSFYDERYTSAIAEDWLLDAGLTSSRRKSRLDMLAAQQILQSFIDFRRSRDRQPETDDHL